MAVKKLESELIASRKGSRWIGPETRVDPQKLKLGKSDARHDPRALLLASY